MKRGREKEITRIFFFVREKKVEIYDAVFMRDLL